MIFIGPAYWLAIVAFLQVWVVRLCARNQALKPWTVYVQFAAFFWCVMAVFKRLYLDEIFPPADALYHEEVARDVAARLGASRFGEAFEYFGLGNPGYRFFLGVFYSLTAAPEWIVYTLNGALGFWGMLALLELLCMHSGCRSLRGIVLFSWLYLPSGLQWTTANLKEGAILWGASMMLYWTLPKNNPQFTSRRGCPLLGMFVLGFLRPHIAIFWIVSINLMSTLRSKRYGLFFLTGGGALVGVLLLQMVAPEMFSSSSGGATTSLSDRYEQFSSNDNLVSSHFIGKEPIPVWTGVLLILFRPWPTEVRSAAELLAGVEVWALAVIGGWGWYCVKGKVRQLTHPSVLVMVFGLLFFGFFFSYMYNMGLVVRQRLMAFPAVLYIYAWPYVCTQKYRVRASRSSVAGQPRSVSRSGNRRHARQLVPGHFTS